ncbi:aldo/keto reductase [Tsukamurella sp. NPDC003166]|uniref:aldo/keto reductase n=1 Tax=Tsukamurella sp. NPDC003166 TaxID=3154444 RepID=UPI0033B2A084
MKYTQLGRSGLQVSRLVLGTMNFGVRTSATDSHAIMDHAHESGINFFDTANVYGVTSQKEVPLGEDSGRGRTEEIIGDWFALGGGRRERTVIATKLYNPTVDWPNSGRASALAIRRECDASLRRLKTDHIDLYQLHHVDRSTPWDEIWEALQVLRNQGKILYAGTSNHAGWHLAQAQESARARGLLGLVSEQSLYNLVKREVERELIPAAIAYGMSILPYAPLHGGFLAAAVGADGGAVRRREGRALQAAETLPDRLARYEEFCRELGAAPATVATAWLLHRPGVAAPIIGPRTVEQLESSIPAVDLDLSGEDMDRLDEIFPGYRTAPEDYAW